MDLMAEFEMPGYSIVIVVVAVIALVVLIVLRKKGKV